MALPLGLNHEGISFPITEATSLAQTTIPCTILLPFPRNSAKAKVWQKFRFDTPQQGRIHYFNPDTIPPGALFAIEIPNVAFEVIGHAQIVTWHDSLYPDYNGAGPVVGIYTAYGPIFINITDPTTAKEFYTHIEKLAVAAAPLFDAVEAATNALCTSLIASLAPSDSAEDVARAKDLKERYVDALQVPSQREANALLPRQPLAAARAAIYWISVALHSKDADVIGWLIANHVGRPAAVDGRFGVAAGALPLPTAADIANTTFDPTTTATTTPGGVTAAVSGAAAAPAAAANGYLLDPDTLLPGWVACLAARTTLLHVLCRNRWTHAAFLALSRGANANAYNDSGRTVAHILCCSAAADDADDSPAGSAPITIIPSGAATATAAGATATATDATAAAPVATSAANDDVLYMTRVAPAAVLLEGLALRGASLTVTDVDGFTPLHLAAKAGRAVLVDKILRHVADTAAAAAASAGSAAAAAVSGESGAGDAGSASPTETEPRHSGGAVSVATHAAQPQVKDGGATALHYAAASGNKGCATLLIEAGVDVNVKNDAGRTPMDVAKTREMSAFLKEHGGVATAGACSVQ